MITLAITYYNAPMMLVEQMREWEKYKGLPVRVLLIDDGSKDAPAEIILNNCGLDFVDLYKIEEDIYMNAVGARNLAFHIAEDWVIQLDIDHIMPVDSLERIINQFKIPDEYYIPNRKRATKLGTRPLLSRHSDSFVLHRDLFWSVGGYDEDLREYYYSGACFLFRQALKRSSAEMVNLEDVYIHFFGSNVIEDASPLLQYPIKEKYYGTKTYHFKPDKSNQLQFTWSKVELKNKNYAHE